MSPPKKKPLIDEAAAKAAFDKLLPRLAQLPKDGLQVPNTSVDGAAIVALRIGRGLTAPAMRERFELLPKKLFAMADLDDLEPAALAAWYASTRLLSANAQGTEAKLPVSLVNEATARRARMLKVCDYNFEPDSVLGREIADIRIGTGYRDLAQDLMRLAKIYRDEKRRLENDKVHYRTEDVAGAEEAAHRILEELAAARGTEQAQWSGRVQRAWTLLVKLYNEVTFTAQWLKRHEGGEGEFPSLVTAGRAARRAKPEPEPAENEEQEPSGGEEAPADDET
jgi:hypothetical protein